MSSISSMWKFPSPTWPTSGANTPWRMTAACAPSTASARRLTGTHTSVGRPRSPGRVASDAQYAVWRACHRRARSSGSVAHCVRQAEIDAMFRAGGPYSCHGRGSRAAEGSRAGRREWKDHTLWQQGGRGRSSRAAEGPAAGRPGAQQQGGRAPSSRAAEGVAAGRPGAWQQERA
eukprot:365718-Chlamydomonas_euryale.AAC.24